MSSRSSRSSKSSRSSSDSPAPFFTQLVGQYFSEDPDFALIPEQELILQREPTNTHDLNAIKVMARGASLDPSEPLRQIGYVRREDAALIAPSMDDWGRESLTAFSYGNTTISIPGGLL